MSRFEFFVRTEVGCSRERNEDAFVAGRLATGQRGLAPQIRIQELSDCTAYIAVCDGMGGAAAGDVAASLAAAQFAQVMEQGYPFADIQALHGSLLTSMQAANRSIADHARRHPEKQGMGSTMTAAYVTGTEAHIVHLGDSRAYLRRGRVLQQISTDHSVVGQMIATGQLTPEQARSYEHRNVLLQALGVQATCTPEVSVVSLRAGDVLLLCTDGLDGHLTDPQILDIMLRQEDPVRCTRALTEAVCRVGGHDNTTVAIGRFVGDGLPMPTPGERIDVQRQSYQVT
jgi:protein phosphatase